MKLANIETFSFAARADWAQDALARGCEVISDGLACFPAVTIVLSHFKTSFSATFNGLRIASYADRYLGTSCYRLNLEEMTGRILRATCNCTAGQSA